MRIPSIILSITVTFSSCSSPQSQIEAQTVDTTQLNTEESQPTEAAESFEPEAIDTEDPEGVSGLTNNFPEFYTNLYTNDSLEAEATNRMIDLLQTYDTIPYSFIISNYLWTRPCYYQGQEGERTQGIESRQETQTWFFDRNHQLKGFSRETRQEGNATRIESVIGLFSNDKLVAFSEQTVDDFAIELIGQQRMLASLCPQCGTAAEYGAGPEGTVRYLSEKDFSTRDRDFNEALAKLISLLKDNRMDHDSDYILDYIFTINQTAEGDPDLQSEDITYPIRLRVEKELFTHLVSIP